MSPFRSTLIGNWVKQWLERSESPPPPRVREVACFKWIPVQRFDCAEKQIGGHHAQIGAFYAQKAAECVWFRIIVTTRDEFFERGEIFFSGVCFLSLLFAVLRVPAGLQSRRAHAVAKVGFVSLLETYFEFQPALSEFISHGERLSVALLAFKLCPLSAEICQPSVA